MTRRRVTGGGLGNRVFWALLCVLSLQTAAEPPATKPATALNQPPAAPVPTGPDGLPLSIDIPLRDVRWQPLPQQVKQVFVGPDQRVWHVMSLPTTPWSQSPPGERADRTVVKRLIEREFARPAPQLWWARPALFEKAGRVWFITSDGQHLLGYSGVPGNWLERSLAADRVFAGTAPGHGRFDYAGCNLALDGRCFFPDTDGVHTFDGKAWSYDPLAPADARVDRSQRAGLRGVPILLPEPDGRGIVAFTHDAQEPFWLYRDGKWNRWPVPPLTHWRFAQVAIDGHRLYFRTGQAMGSYPLPRSLEAPADLNRLIQQLGDRERTLREQATDKLVEKGEPVRAAIEQSILKSTDEEILARLRLVLARLNRAALKPAAGESADYPIGEYALRRVMGFHGEVDGTMFFSAGGISRNGAELGEGVVVVPPPGKPGQIKVIAGDAMGMSFFRYAGGPIGYLPASQIWTAGLDGFPPAKRLDLKNGAVQTLPDVNFSYLHALKEDGTVFAAAQAPSSYRRPQSPIMVFRPDLPDERTIVRAASARIGSIDFCVASDGSVWCVDPGANLIRFDGREWRTMHSLPANYTAVQFVAGEERMVFMSARPLQGPGGGMLYVLFKGERCVEFSSLQKLVEEKAPEIRRGFSATRRPRGGREAPFVADKQGNIWMNDRENPRVYVNGAWIDIAPAIREARDQRFASRVMPDRISGFGDGTRVFLNEFANRQQGFVLSVNNGRVEAQLVLPVTRDHFLNGRVTHDGENAIWARVDRYSPPDADGNRTSEHITRRLNAQGVEEMPRELGSPCFADDLGRIWLRDLPPRSDLLRIWSQGKTTELTIPGAADSIALAAAGPNSLYAWTSQGVMRLVGDPANPARFNVSKPFFPSAEEGNIRPVLSPYDYRLEYSPLGFLVSSHPTHLMNTQPYSLNLIPLPGGPADGKILAGPGTRPSTRPALVSPSPYPEPHDPRKIPQRLNITIGPQQWQALPTEVRQVLVGPDDRTWLLMGNDTMPFFIDQQTARTLIEREFDQPAPQLWGIAPALFEPPPSKRVWFLHHNTLLGYDGTPGLWYERPSTSTAYRSLETGRFGSRPGPRNLAIDEALYFPNSLGIDLLLDRHWKRLEVPSPLLTREIAPGRTESYRPGCAWEILAQAPDRKAVFALTLSPNPAVWRYGNGAWTSHALPQQIISRGVIGAAPISDDRFAILVRQTSRDPRKPDAAELIQIPISQQKVAPAVFNKLLAGLAAGQFKDREKASRDLIALGLPAIEPIRAALEKEEDAEVRARLQQALGAIESPPAEKPLFIGDYTITQASALHATGQGTILVSVVSGSANNQELGPGLFIAAPASKPRFLAGAAYTIPVAGRFMSDRPALPLFSSDARYLALPGATDRMRRAEEVPARIVDLVTGSVTSLPSKEFTSPDGILRDGSLFVRQGDRPGSRNAPVVLFRPQGTDRPTALKAQRLEVASESFVVASDGAIWAMSGQGAGGVIVMHKAQQVVAAGGAGGIVQFDGKQWQQRLAARLAGNPRFLATGNNGEVLSLNESFGGYWFGSATESHESKNLLDLIQKNHPAFVKAFAHPRPVARDPYGAAFTVDRAGHVWVVSDEPFKKRLLVLVNQQWIDCADELVRANGGKALDARGFDFVDLLATVGDGSQVWAMNSRARPGLSISFIGNIVDGKPRFEPTAFLPTRESPIVGRDPQGRLHFVQANAAVCRWDPKGPTELIKDPSSHFRVDPAGNLWGISYPRDGKATVSVWRDGKPAASIDVLVEGHNAALPVFGKDGALFIKTPAGIEHYQASLAPPKVSIQRRAVYVLQDQNGDPVQDLLSIGYSDSGFLIAVAGRVTDQGWRRALFLAPISARPPQ